MRPRDLDTQDSSRRDFGGVREHSHHTRIPETDIPMREIPVWGPRITVDGATLDLHRPSAYQVDMILPRHLITYWLEPSQGSRGIGSGDVTKVRFEKGSFNVTPAGTRLRAISEKPSQALLFSIAPNYIERVMPARNARPSTTVPMLQGAAVPTMHHLAELARSQLTTGLPPDVLFIETLLIMVLIEVQRQTALSSGLLGATPETGSALRLARVREYIAANLSSPLTLTELAAEANMSLYHFARCFKKAVGLSPHQYVIKVRLEKSKQLLEQSSYAVSDIALLCGFSHQAHFSQVFKRYRGVTPGEYRLKKTT